MAPTCHCGKGCKVYLSKVRPGIPVVTTACYSKWLALQWKKKR